MRLSTTPLDARYAPPVAYIVSLHVVVRGTAVLGGYMQRALVRRIFDVAVDAAPGSMCVITRTTGTRDISVIVT